MDRFAECWRTRWPNVVARELEGKRVSVIAVSGMTFDLTPRHGRMVAMLVSGIAEFEQT
jgi:DNA invertase Pin-like site-specific DNA recombinase